jgi:D-beta-D-heptose 7-phosphate kinase/D-beta-D-heptose 1-phosphate adenosyltransferase
MKTYGIVSGYFNPVHRGHIDYFEEAKKHCDYLFAIVNNDQQVKVKGSKPFMDEVERQRIVAAIRYVDEAMISIDTDASVSKSIAAIAERLETIASVMFFNSGDRDPGTYNIAESDVCERLAVIPFFLELPKVNSSSKLLS